MYTTLLIEYANPLDLADSITVDFKLRDHSFIARWIERVETAQKQYSIDDPARFYGFGSTESQRETALFRINNCIDIINSQRELVWRRPESVDDQDALNYLHHIFEVYHGLLDKQENQNLILREALANLNICVHRCESVSRGAAPRHVVTWFGLPKDKLLNVSDYKLFTDEWQCGTVMLNYAEIGKTLYDLAMDNDKYIAPDAFQPYQHYSADFNVKFFDTDPLQVIKERAKIDTYYRDNIDIFGTWNVNFSNGSIPLADAINPIVLSDIEPRQYVKSVSFK